MDGKETKIVDDIENQQRIDILNFPNDTVFQPNVAEDRREGEVKVFTKDEIQIATLFYENGMLNGLCKFYENGNVNKIHSFVNGKMEGWSKEGEKEYIYENNCKVFELVKNEKLKGYVNEINIKTRMINRCYKMNENHKADGVGYVFENGNVVRKVEYKNDKEVIVLIEIAKEMTERDVFGNIIYQGGYRIDRDNLEFKKKGLGRIYNNENILLFDGMWENDVPEGEGCLYDVGGNEICKGNWVDGVCGGWSWDGRKFGEFIRERKEKRFMFWNIGDWIENMKKGLGKNDNKHTFDGMWEKIVSEGKDFCKGKKFGKCEIKIGKRVLHINTTVLLLIILSIFFIWYFSNVVVWISSTKKLKSLVNSQYKKKQLRVLIVIMYCCNDMEVLDIRGFMNLEMIVVMRNSLIDMKYLIIEGL